MGRVCVCFGFNGMLPEICQIIAFLLTCYVPITTDSITRSCTIGNRLGTSERAKKKKEKRDLRVTKICSCGSDNRTALQLSWRPEEAGEIPEEAVISQSLLIRNMRESDNQFNNA